MPHNFKRAEWILRLGLAFAFIYAAMASYFSPGDWVGFLPPFVGKIVDPLLALSLFGLVQLIVSIWLLVAKNVFWPSLIMALMLLGIIVTDFAGFAVIFRDVSILAMALALMTLYWPNRSAQNPLP